MLTGSKRYVGKQMFAKVVYWRGLILGAHLSFEIDRGCACRATCGACCLFANFGGPSE